MIIIKLLSEHKRAFILTALIISITLIIGSALYRGNPTIFENTLGLLLTPVQNGITSVTGFFRDKFEFYNGLHRLNDENMALRDEISRLQTDNDRLRLIEAENEKLSELLKIDKKYPDYPTIGAEIISRDTSNWFNKFVINKGTKDGVNKNMVVIAAGGLVGRIIESGYNYSKVVALVDDTSSVTAKSVRSDDVGFVKGDMTLRDKGMCRMEFIGIDAKLIEGDEIVTSQLSDIYPPGITIGHVKEVGTDTNGLTKYAFVELVVDFKHLETVLVIVPEKEDF